MPQNVSLKKVLVFGASSLNENHISENDFAVAQACRVFHEKGLEVVLISPNPNSIITDKCLVAQIYIEPLTLETVKRIIIKEKVDSLFPVLAGQSGLTLALQLSVSTFLSNNNVTLLGVTTQSINNSQEFQAFKDVMLKMNEPCIPSKMAASLKDAVLFAESSIGYPVTVRPAVLFGRAPGRIVNNQEEMIETVTQLLKKSPLHQVLVEKCIAGWKEIDFILMRDEYGHCITAGSVENFDPVGTSDGRFISVSPAVSLSEDEMQILQSAAIRITNAFGITGECNIKFGLKPNSKEYVVIEVNPRACEFTPFVTKATGYPIPRVAGLLAIGYSLPEVSKVNDDRTCFSPKPDSICVSCNIKNPSMAFGRTFEEALMKALRTNTDGTLGLRLKDYEGETNDDIRKHVQEEKALKVYAIFEAIKRNIMSHEEIYRETKVDWWFLDHIQNIADLEKKLEDVKKGIGTLSIDLYVDLKKFGYSDDLIQAITSLSIIGANGVKAQSQDALSLTKSRKLAHVNSVYKRVSYSEPHFENYHPYFYCAYDTMDEAEPYLSSIAQRSQKGTILIIDSGSNLYGQSCETDYASILCAKTYRQMGYEVVIMNNSPIDVASDFGYADRLYIEPVTAEDVMNVIYMEKPVGVVTAFGGEDSIKLTKFLEQQDVKILGANAEATFISKNLVTTQSFMDGPEFEVNLISDTRNTFIPGIMERFVSEEKDVVEVYPVMNLSDVLREMMIKKSSEIALKLEVRGLLTIRFINYNNDLYVKEVSAVVSANIPFISKITGLPVVSLASRVMLGQSLEEVGIKTQIHSVPPYFAVKYPVYDYKRQNHGQVLGLSSIKKEAIYKGLIASGNTMSSKGNILFNIQKSDIQKLPPVAKKFESLGFNLYASEENIPVLNEFGIKAGTFTSGNFEEKLDYIITSSATGFKSYSIDKKIPCITSFDIADSVADCLLLGFSPENTQLINIRNLFDSEQKMHFEKYDCTGDDYIILNADDYNIYNPCAFAVKLCNRKTSIGAEKLIIVKKAKTADFSMEVYSSKGELQTQYGNEIRAVAKYVNDNNLLSSQNTRTVSIETKAGVQNVTLYKNNNKVSSVELFMHLPESAPQNITVCAEGLNYNAVKVLFERDNCVLFSNYVDMVDVEKNGPVFERNEAFPDGADIQFVKVESPNKIKMRSWQMGTGEVQSSPSGAVAAVIASVINGYCKKNQEISVELPGGVLTVKYTDDGVSLTGGVSCLFQGEISVQ
jgi:carbamoyl-phosphate synthase large subunit